MDEDLLPASRKVYNRGSRKIKSKTVADVVEALIGAFLSTGGEAAAVAFIGWLGIKVDFVNVLYKRQFPVQPEKLVNIIFFESLLNYSFRDASLLVEALTHGSYMLPEIPGCYQVIFCILNCQLLHLLCKLFCCKFTYFEQKSF